MITMAGGDEIEFMLVRFQIGELVRRRAPCIRVDIEGAPPAGITVNPFPCQVLLGFGEAQFLGPLPGVRLLQNAWSARDSGEKVCEGLIERREDPVDVKGESHSKSS